MSGIINHLCVCHAMELGLLILIALVLLLACILQGITGFGQSLLAVPILISLMSPRSVAPLMLLAGTVLNLILALNARRHIRLGRIWPLVLGGIVGVPFGMMSLLMLPSWVIRIAVGAMIILFSIVLILGFSLRIKRERSALFPVGFVSGLLNGAVTMSGPPVILFFTNQELGKEEFRANLVVYFLILNLFTMPVFFAGGLFHMEIITAFLLVIPVLIVGSFLGIYLSGKLSRTLFRKVALVIVILAGISSVISGLGMI